jgi:Protein of unknown function (DUF2809)
MFEFNRRYFVIALVLFLILVFIAAFVRDRFVRPYFGDYLVVIFLYCLAKAFLSISPIRIIIGVLLFAYLIETLQYFHILKILGWEDVVLARVILGNGFEWWDLVAYTLGAATIVLVESLKNLFSKIK